MTAGPLCGVGPTAWHHHHNGKVLAPGVVIDWYARGHARRLGEHGAEVAFVERGVEGEQVGHRDHHVLHAPGGGRADGICVNGGDSIRIHDRRKDLGSGKI